MRTGDPGLVLSMVRFVLLKGELCRWVEVVLGLGLEGAAGQEESGGCWDPAGERRWCLTWGPGRLETKVAAVLP